MTDAERTLWRALRLRQLEGLKFRRQHRVGPYIVDFACITARLVVEVDGGQHLDSEYDDRRDAFLRRQGWRVLRFWNNDVMRDMAAVVDAILQAAGPHPGLPPQAGEGEEGSLLPSQAGEGE